MSLHLFSISGIETVLHGGHLQWAGLLAAFGVSRSYQPGRPSSDGFADMPDHLLRDIGLEPHVVKDQARMKYPRNLPRA